MEALTNFIEQREVQAVGKASFAITVFGTLINLVTQMGFLNAFLLIITSILGILFMCLKIWIVRIQIIEANEERVKNGEKPIKFFQFWRINRKKND